MKYIVVFVCVTLLVGFVYPFFKAKELDIKNLSENFYDYSLELIDGEKITLDKYKGKKVIIVNVASKCGYTYQYGGLQNLYEEYSDKIEIIGIPSNDFMWQEPGKNKDIQTFCSVNYGVTFPIIKKTVVKKNINQHPIYSWLSSKQLNGWNDSEPGWNFYKYLVNEKGELVDILSSKVKPQDKKIIDFINN
ncbi:MAG: glutathione peroxidase [Candidatus Marinimicrobia bacterium]|nr:glutathione peroxidase [Candidatus Neomarinimicrobiota bacterium]|tara:strand:+ start:4575 stop:5147 length:573 start_codon:yes stop_codon:yes gene_type:complete